jgi:2,3-bisphosphoglycerate-dependent phosphoglycerate mutase
MRPLSARGQSDAQQVADVLAQYAISMLISSPYTRARQTIAPLAARRRLAIHIETDLRERRLGGESATHPFTDGTRFLAAVRATWRDFDFAHPGGESNTAAQERGVAVVTQLQAAYPGESLVLSTHGNLLALILQHFDPNIDFNFWHNLTMPDIYCLRLTVETRPSIEHVWSPT